MISPAKPCVRIFPTTLSASFAADVETGALVLSFDYGGTRIAANDPRPRFFCTTAEGVFTVERDVGFELETRRLLEGFGAIEARCLVRVVAADDADYILDQDADVHALCTFSARAIPALRARGVSVEVTPDYPWQTVAAAPDWYLEVGEDAPGWLGFELGIDIDGARQNLLPILLDLITHPRDGLELTTLASSKLRHVGVRLGHNRCLAIEPQRLHNILCVLLELYHPGDAAVARLVLRDLQAASLAHLEEAVGGAKLLGSSSARGRVRALGALGREPAFTPPGLQASLRPYQREGLAWLTDLGEQGLGGILADDMGLGKTIQVIAHLLGERERGRLLAPALVVVPTSVLCSWERELCRFAPSLVLQSVRGPRREALWQKAARAEVVLTTYPVLLRDEAAAARIAYSLVVLDEAQTIKNRHSRIHQAVRSLSAKRRLCLTVTPMENHLGELWSLFDTVAEGLLGDAASFREAFAIPIERMGAPELASALARRVAPFILRRKKEEVARDLPPKTEIMWPVELVGDQRDLYETIRLAVHQQVQEAISARGLEGSTIAVLDALMKLRQVCCDPRLLKLEAAQAVRTSVKYHTLFSLLLPQIERGHRVLVFSQFTSMLALIAKGLYERQIPHAVLTGATSNRQRQVDSFQRHDAPVFLISLKAGGTGLTLTAADTVIHYDPWWNPAAHAQASDRAYRIGQQRPVFVYNLIVKGSVEERILAMQHRKRALADALLDGGGALGLSPADVEALIAPLGRISYAASEL